MVLGTVAKVKNDIFESIENLRKFQKFSKKIFEAIFDSIVNYLKNLADKLINENILISTKKIESM